MRYALAFSTFMVLVLGGALGGFYYWRPDDAHFFYDYNMMSDADRQILRDDALRVIASTRVDSKEELVDFYKGKAYEEIIKEVGGAENLIAQSASTLRSNIETAQRVDAQSQAMLERHQVRSNEYGDFAAKLEAERKQLELEREEFRREVKEFRDIQASKALAQIIAAADKTEKIQEIVPRVTGRPVLEQIHILQSMKDPKKASDLAALLPAEEQAAIKARETNMIAEEAAQLERANQAANLGTAATPGS